MPIPADQALIAEVGLAAFAARAPDRVRDKVQILYRRERNSYILYQWRITFSRPGEWHEEPVAKFTYNATKRTWKLLRMDRNLRWRKYEWAEETPDLERLLAEVDRDPYCFFWG